MPADGWPKCIGITGRPGRTRAIARLPIAPAGNGSTPGAHAGHRPHADLAGVERFDRGAARGEWVGHVRSDRGERWASDSVGGRTVASSRRRPQILLTPKESHDDGSPLAD